MSTLVSTYTIAAPAPPGGVLRCLHGKRLWCQGPCQVTANLHAECVFLCFNMFAYLFCCIFFLLDYSFHEQFATRNGETSRVFTCVHTCRNLATPGHEICNLVVGNCLLCTEEGLYCMIQRINKV